MLHDIALYKFTIDSDIDIRAVKWVLLFDVVTFPKDVSFYSCCYSSSLLLYDLLSLP